MKRVAGYRKANFAAYVKINMLTMAGPGIVKRAKEMHILLIKTRVWRKKILDNVWELNIIIFTYIAGCFRVPHARKRCQARHPAATRNSKSAASRRYRSPVYQRHLLRSQGSGPGQIRDATPRAERGPFGDGRRDGFRLFPALVLSSAGSLRGGWAVRPGPPQTRSQAGTQADRRGPGLPHRDTPEGAVGADTRTGALDPRAFRDQGAS